MLTRAITLFVFALSSLSPSLANDDYAMFSRSSFEGVKVADFDEIEGSGFSLTYGLALSEVVSIEASFGRFEFDDYEQDYVLTNSRETGTIYLEGKAESIDIAVLFKKQSGQLTPFLMFGHMEFDASDATFRNIVGDIDDLDTLGESSDSFYGFGADWAIPDSSYAVRASYKSTGSDIDLDFMSLGLILNF